MEILAFLLAPFVASLILTGIHAYLGVHVVERGVIFVDLALAQIAALGATVAVVAGMDPHGRGSYWISLGFTFLGAAIFSFARSARGHIPQEAFIGIAYAVASATAILLMSKATGETEHLKDMLVGNILAVSWPEVRKTAFLYGAIGIFHFIFRKKFLSISMNHGKAEQSGMNVRFWDFLFYASFGFVVTLPWPLPEYCWFSVTLSSPAWEQCYSQIVLARVSRSVGQWARSFRRWAATSACSWIRRPVPRSSSLLVAYWSSCSSCT